MAGGIWQTCEAGDRAVQEAPTSAAEWQWAGGMGHPIYYPMPKEHCGLGCVHSLAPEEILETPVEISRKVFSPRMPQGSGTSVGASLRQ